MISGCESNVPTQSVDESETLQESVENLDQKNKSSDGRLLKDVLEDLEPGIITKSYFTDKMRKFLEEKGIDPNQVRLQDDIPDNVKLFWGEEAKNDLMKDQKIEGKDYGKVSAFFDPEYSSEFQLLGGNEVPAFTEFEVVEVPNPPASGSVTVQYGGVQVTTNYTSSWNKYAVANTISSNINNNSNIQLTATVNGSTVRVTEKRDGCNYNGNPVYVSHTNGTHISVNNDTFYMANGHDGEGWCEPIDDEVPPPPTPIQVLGRSWINTNQVTGEVAMASDSWASQAIYNISVAGKSYEDGFLIANLYDENDSSNYAIVGIVTYKSPQAPTVQWEQVGAHYWWINASDNVIWYDISYKKSNF